MRILNILVFILIFGCSNSNTKIAKKVNENSNAKDILVKHKNFVNVEERILKQLESWNELRDLQDFLKTFENISATDALNSALELRNLFRDFMEDIPIKELKTDEFDARINVMNNEILRLVDLTYINVISADEVNLQVDKVFAAYDALLNKIRNVYIKNEFESEVYNQNKIFKVLKNDIKKTNLNSKSKQIELKHKEPSKQKLKQLINKN